MSDIRETLTNFTKNVTKSSGDLFKSTKLSMSVSTEQNNLKNLHLEIGKKVHEIYQYGGSLGKFFDEKYREIEACELRIEELKEQISLIKGTRECSKCGKSAERTAEFCPKCGMRFAASSLPAEQAAMPIQAPQAGHDPSQQQFEAGVTTPHISHPVEAIIPTSQQVEIVQQPPAAIAAELQKTTRHCRVCGMENDIATKFCLSCGRIVD